jgi:hypothetical protein
MVLWDLFSNFLFIYLGSAASGPRHICDIIDLPTEASCPTLEEGLFKLGIFFSLGYHTLVTNIKETKQEKYNLFNHLHSFTLFFGVPW